MIGIDASATPAKSRAQILRIAQNTAGLIDRVRLGEFPQGSRVPYAHLGGVPALNAYSFLFRNG